MGSEVGTLFAYILGLFLLIILGKVLLVPMKIFIKLVFNTVIGGAMLIVINFIGSYFNFNISVNFISAIIVGILGVPGIIFLVVMKYFF